MVNKNLQRKVVNHFGVREQSIIAMEECSELIQAISKAMRYPNDIGRHNNLAEEIADVLLCIEQIKSIYNVEDVEIDRWTDFKQTRQLDRMGIKGLYVENGEFGTY